MKRFTFLIFVFASLVLASSVLAVSAPTLPMAFYGTTTINSVSLPSASVIRAYYGSASSNSGSLTTAAAGKYGAVDPDSFKAQSDVPLLVSEGTGTIYFKATVSGYNDGSSITANQTTTFSAGTTGRLNLTFTVPTAPTAASVKAGASSSANYINSHNVSSVTVTVTPGAALAATDIIIVSLSDGSLTATGSSTGFTGSSAQDVTGIDASSLADGAITVTAKIRDSNNITSAILTGTSAVKDVGGPSTPVASPNGGEHHSSQSVTLTAAGSTAIYYTTDGTAPDNTDTLYSAAITINSNTTLKAIAYDDSSNTSSVLTKTFTFTCSTASVANGTVSAYSSCAITCNSGYTLSGSTCVSSGGGGGGGGGGGDSTPSVVTPTTATGQVTATAAAGGKTTITSAENTIASVTLPVNAVNANTTITITPTAKSAAAVSAVAAAVPAGKSLVGSYVYNYSAQSAAGAAITNFSKSITVTLTYTDAQISNLNESTLKVYYYKESTSEWVVLPTTINTQTNTLTAATNHFTYFAIIGEPAGAAAATSAKPFSQMTIAELQAEIARIMALIIQLQSQIAGFQTQPSAIVGIPADFKFKVNLKYKQVAIDVKYLQIILNSDSNTRIAESGIGSSGQETNIFGDLTKAAVIKFQEKYASEILAPAGLTKGTGIVGSSTRAKLNILLGK